MVEDFRHDKPADPDAGHVAGRSPAQIVRRRVAYPEPLAALRFTSRADIGPVKIARQRGLSNLQLAHGARIPVVGIFSGPAA